jgi:hypothetical protein
MSLSSLVPNEGYSLRPKLCSFDAEIAAYCGKSEFCALSSAQDGPVSAGIAALERRRT